MMAWNGIRVLCALAAAVLALAPGMVVAEMLDEPACNQLKNEQARLAAEGLKTEMLHGPDWAKANLPASRLEQIKHLIEVEEKIAFRCPLPPPPKPVEPAVAQPAGDDGKPKAVRKKTKKKDAEGAPAAAEPAVAEPDAPAPVKKKPKAVKKKKPAEDAYVPPPATGNAFVDGEAGPVQQAPKLAP
jgi:hypothetical protein